MARTRRRAARSRPERRTSIDTARFFKRLSDEVYAGATTTLLVMDNLSTHSTACLYEAFPPAEARRVARRFEFRHTPRQGSWLDVAEIFLSTMSIECLEQRVQDAPTLRTLVDAWMRSRKSGKVRWRSRAEDARIKPHPLYPSLPEIRGTSRNGAMTSQMDATASPKSRRKLAFVLR